MGAGHSVGRLLAMSLALSAQGCSVIWDSNGQRHAAGIGYVAWPKPQPSGRAQVAGVNTLGVTAFATSATIGVAIGLARERIITAEPWVAGASPNAARYAITWEDSVMRHAVGIGMVSWAVPDRDATIIASGLDVIGAAALGSVAGAEVSLGYSRRRTIIINGDKFIRLDCLACDFAKANPTTGTSEGDIR